MVVKAATLKSITTGREIAAGGEGKIYEHFSRKDKVIKVYHQARSSKYAAHLQKISKLDPIFFVMPENIYIDSKDNVLGFDMEYVNFNDYWLFNNLFNKGFCTSNNIDKIFKMQILKELAICLENVHKLGITIGDLNQYNLFVSKKKSILFVDTDSYQTDTQPHSGVLLDDIRDWTTQDINDKTDIWAYDILAFWATTYVHPFKWVVPGNKESLEQRVRSNKSILSKIPDIKIPPLYLPPVPDEEKQFKEIFTGRRYMINFGGSYIQAPIIVTQPISTSNNLNIKEIYQDVKSINVSNNEVAIKIIGNTGWLTVELKIKGLFRLIGGNECDELYPSDNQSAYVIGKTLYGFDGKYMKSFVQPKFMYNNGSLGVIDYQTDQQWNFNLNNQLGNSIDSSYTPVFAKSIIIRDAIIQNFGSQKYINVPVNNRYSMIKMPDGIKNAYHSAGSTAIEYKEKSTVYYVIRSSFGDIDFDYFPYFTSMGNGMIAVPDNGYIDIYKSTSANAIVRLDCPICTRNSKLYNTNAGILLLENNILYLLNTK